MIFIMKVKKMTKIHWKIRSYFEDVESTAIFSSFSASLYLS